MNRSSERNLQAKVLNAAKWSTITELMAKLISPITNMILARLLAPEAFGVVATVTMVISFADMFTDSGFQKYLVQQNFTSDEEKYRFTNVAFWTNLGLSIAFWIIIFLFREPIAAIVGSPGLGDVLAIASLQLPLTAFSSIQMALYRRDFDFKTLFLVRIIAIVIPFVVTIPLAFIGLNYWALIIGTLAIRLSNAIVLTVKSKWKPKIFYSGAVFKKMFSFSFWSLIEQISIWLTTWVDSFIIASVLSQYELGLYKTSTSMVNTLMAIITAAIMPVLFSTLSRLQDDDTQFKNIYFKFQKFVSVIVFPLGVGVFLFSDLATQILLGSKWYEASPIIGVWALTSSIQIVLSHFSSEVYRAKGKPKLSFLSQILHLIFLVPACIISAKFGFWALVYTRSWIRMQGVLVNFAIMKYKFDFSIGKTLKNVFPTVFSAVVMGFFGALLNSVNEGLLWQISSIFFCIIFYFAILSIFPSIRMEIKPFLLQLKKKGR